MLKAAIYSRKSKYTEEGESIETQIKMCIEYAKNILDITKYEIYEDEGFSGGNINRPKFKQVIEDIKNHKFTHLICYRLDRISRNVADFTTTLELLNKYNVSFVSIKEQFDTSSAMGRAMMNISATFAQLERETIAERIKDNLRELSKTGRWLGGPTPLGYKSIEVENDDSKGKSRKKHILSIDEDNSKIVTMVYDLFLKYKSFNTVSLYLENHGIYSPKGKVFSRQLVKQMINNPVYCIADKEILDYFKKYGCEIYKENYIDNIKGIMPYNRRNKKGSLLSIENWIISIGDHSGLIDSHTWIQCQNIAAKIKDNASNRQCTSDHAILSGLVICAHCGSGMAPRKQVCKSINGDKTMYRYYSCNLKNKAKDRCDNTALNAYNAEDYVINKIKSITKKDLLNIYLRNNEKFKTNLDSTKTIDTLKEQISINEKSISTLVRKVAALDENLDTNKVIQESYEKEIITLSKNILELKNKIKSLEEKNNEFENEIKNLFKIIETFDNFKRFFDYTANFEDRKRLIRSVIKFVVWDSSKETLDIIPVGSKLEKSDFSPLGNRNRRTSSR